MFQRKKTPFIKLFTLLIWVAMALLFSCATGNISREPMIDVSTRENVKKRGTIPGQSSDILIQP